MQAVNIAHHIYMYLVINSKFRFCIALVMNSFCIYLSISISLLVW